MITEKRKKIENQLRILEKDIVNNTDILVLQAYVVIDEGSTVFSYDIFNKNLFNANKETYTKEMLNFKNKCEEEVVF